MKRAGRAAEGERFLLPALMVSLCVFALLGYASIAKSHQTDNTFFPLLKGAASRLDAVAEELKAGLPIQEAAEAFFNHGNQN